MRNSWGTGSNGVWRLLEQGQLVSFSWLISNWFRYSSCVVACGRCDEDLQKSLIPGEAQAEKE